MRSALAAGSAFSRRAVSTRTARPAGDRLYFRLAISSSAPRRTNHTPRVITDGKDAIRYRNRLTPARVAGTAQKTSTGIDSFATTPPHRGRIGRGVAPTFWKPKDPKKANPATEGGVLN